MLENEQKLDAINQEDVFASMLREIPWDSLKTFVQTNTQINKICTRGGHRLDKKRRKRFEKIISREAAKKNFAADITSGLFAQWYPAQKKLHDALEEYFESDEYETYRKEQEIDEQEYVLPDDIFAKFFEPKQVQKWRILLCFSPLKFSDQQADRILQESEGNAEVLQQVQEIQAETEKERQEKNRLLNENNDLRSRIEELNAADKEIRSERKELRAEREALQNKFETAQSEIRKLNEKISEIENARKEQHLAASADIEREKKRLEGDLKQTQHELESWKEKYEEERAEGRQLRKKLKHAEKVLADERTTRMNREKEYQKFETFADAILARIDWREVGRQMKLTPQLKRKFNSLMRSLNYEEDRSINLGGTLKEFWNKLQTQEKNLIEAIAESDTREVQQGDVEDYWNSLTDEFQDVTIGLEARTVLLQMLQEAFYQTLSMEDLEQAVTPGRAKKSRKKKSTSTNTANAAVGKS